MGTVLHLGLVPGNLPQASLQFPVGHDDKLPELKPQGGGTETQAFRQRMPGGLFKTGFRIKFFAGVTPFQTVNILFRGDHHAG